jgi:hypothetical protein
VDAEVKDWYLSVSTCRFSKKNYLKKKFFNTLFTDKKIP